uniref:Secreted protein n=1 Tax=Anopheles farauti TaxID=69004 RepID=A0A182QRY0_9DIPT
MVFVARREPDARGGRSRATAQLLLLLLLMASLFGHDFVDLAQLLQVVVVAVVVVVAAGRWRRGEWSNLQDTVVHRALGGGTNDGFNRGRRSISDTSVVAVSCGGANELRLLSMRSSSSSSSSFMSSVSCSVVLVGTVLPTSVASSSSLSVVVTLPVLAGTVEPVETSCVLLLTNASTSVPPVSPSRSVVVPVLPPSSSATVGSVVLPASATGTALGLNLTDERTVGETFEREKGDVLRVGGFGAILVHPSGGGGGRRKKGLLGGRLLRVAHRDRRYLRLVLVGGRDLHHGGIVETGRRYILVRVLGRLRNGRQRRFGRQIDAQRQVHLKRARRVVIVVVIVLPGAGAITATVAMLREQTLQLRHENVRRVDAHHLDAFAVVVYLVVRRAGGRVVAVEERIGTHFYRRVADDLVLLEEISDLVKAGTLRAINHPSSLSFRPKRPNGIPSTMISSSSQLGASIFFQTPRSPV